MPLHTWTFVINVRREDDNGKIPLNSRLIICPIDTAQAVPSFSCAAIVVRKLTAARNSCTEMEIT